MKENDISVYREFVEGLAISNSAEIFRNSGTDYASIVFGNLFTTSTDKLRIFSGQMNKDVTDKQYYYDRLVDFVRNGGKVDVMLEKGKEDPTSQAYKFLEERAAVYPDKIRIRKGVGLPFALRGKDNERIPIHFTTGDDNSFRIETEKDFHRAMCCFNNDEITSNLITLFDEKFNENFA